MFKRGFSLFAALLLSGPVSAKQSLSRPDEPLDVEARLKRAHLITEGLDRPVDYGGVTRSADDPDKFSWYNFRNWANFGNFRNWNNFVNNWHNFANFANFANFGNFGNVIPIPQIQVPDDSGGDQE